MQAATLIQQLQQDARTAPLLAALESPTPSGPDWRWLDCDALLDSGTLTPLLTAFAAQEGHAGGDLRAIASLWSRWHFWAVLPPVVAALLLHQHLLQPQSVALSPQLRSCGLQWAAPLPATDAQAACAQLVAQAQPLVARLAQVSGASPKVFWNNLGNLLDYLVAQLRTHPCASAPMQQAFDALLTAPQLADGSPNPLQHPVRYLHDAKTHTAAATAAPRRVRKLCCLYYLLPGMALCSNCPRPPSASCGSSCHV